MPDKFHAEGTVDIKVVVYIEGVPVEGYGQTAQEAKDDAKSGIREQLEGRSQTRELIESIQMGKSAEVDVSSITFGSVEAKEIGD